MDAQGVEAAFLFPTLGVGMEELLKHDIEALHHAFHAFNNWLHEDWGFAHRNRIFAAPVIPLADPEAAVRELESVLERDARIVLLKMAPVPTADGLRSLGDPLFDRFYALANEAGIVLGFHTGDSGYARFTDEWEPTGSVRSFLFTPFRLLTYDRAIYDTMAALLCHGVFQRFPNLRVLSVENGATWARHLFANLEKVMKTESAAFPEHPIETFKRHVWVSPFQEDDIDDFVALLGADRVVLGSDWPHAEGLPAPARFQESLESQPPAAVRAILRENTLSLTRRAA